MANTKISALTSATTPLAGTETLPVVQSSTTKQISVANLTAGRAVSALSFTASQTASIFSQDGVAGTGLNVAYNGTYYTLITEQGYYVYNNPLVINTVNNYGITIKTNNTSRVNISSAGDVTINTGNIIQGIAGKGFNFNSNTPASGMTSQLLNWYEEGTFTPTLYGGTTAGVGTYTAQTGYYTRTGRIVNVQIYIECSSHTGTGSMNVGALPFISRSFSGAPIGLFNSIPLTVANVATANTAAGGYNIVFRQYPVGGGSVTNIPLDTGYQELIVSATYYTS
jgi:hypothetical protein